MPGCVSCRLYLLPDALENFGVLLDLRSREISNFPTHLEVNTADRKHTLSYIRIVIPNIRIPFSVFVPIPSMYSLP